MANPVIIFETNVGNIELELMPEVAPKTCENFIGLVNKGYYNGVTFHRVIPGFMIQGGDPKGTGTGGTSIWGTEFEDECSPNVKFDQNYLLAMANRGPNTNGSQFFITTALTPWLHMKHTIFGKVVSGSSVVADIESSPRDAADRPRHERKIVTAKVKEAAAE